MDFPPRPPPVRPAAPIIGHRRCPMQHNIYSRALTGVRVRITEQPAGPFFTSPILKARTRDRNRPRLRASPETASPGSHSRPRARVFRAVAAVGTKVVGCAAATANTNPRGRSLLIATAAKPVPMEDRNRPRALLTPPETASPGLYPSPSIRAIRVVAAASCESSAATANTNPPAGGDVLASFPSGRLAAPRAPRAGFCVSE